MLVAVIPHTAIRKNYTIAFVLNTISNTQIKQLEVIPSQEIIKAHEYVFISQKTTVTYLDKCMRVCMRRLRFRNQAKAITPYCLFIYFMLYILLDATKLLKY